MVWASRLLRFIEEVWKQPFHGNQMVILKQKLKNLKASHKSWNVDVFGDVGSKFPKLCKKWTRCNLSFSKMAFSDELFLLEVDALLVYREVFYKEKSNQKWFFQGSHNMTFFHHMVKQKQATNHISILKNGDDILQSQYQIQQHITCFYYELFASNNQCSPNVFKSTTLFLNWLPKRTTLSYLISPLLKKLDIQFLIWVALVP